MPWLGAALSTGFVALTRTVASVLDGLWQNTQYSVLLRSDPWSCRLTWQPLQLASATTPRRGVTVDPSTEKYDTGFGVAYCTLNCEVVPGSTISVRRASMPIA